MPGLARFGRSRLRGLRGIRRLSGARLLVRFVRAVLLRVARLRRLRRPLRLVGLGGLRGGAVRARLRGRAWVGRLIGVAGLRRLHRLAGLEDPARHRAVARDQDEATGTGVLATWLHRGRTGDDRRAVASARGRGGPTVAGTAVTAVAATGGHQRRGRRNGHRHGRRCRGGRKRRSGRAAACGTAATGGTTAVGEDRGVAGDPGVLARGAGATGEPRCHARTAGTGRTRRTRGPGRTAALRDVGLPGRTRRRGGARTGGGTTRGLAVALGLPVVPHQVEAVPGQPDAAVGEVGGAQLLGAPVAAAGDLPHRAARAEPLRALAQLRPLQPVAPLRPGGVGADGVTPVYPRVITACGEAQDERCAGKRSQQAPDTIHGLILSYAPPVNHLAGGDISHGARDVVRKNSRKQGRTGRRQCSVHHKRTVIRIAVA